MHESYFTKLKVLNEPVRQHLKTLAGVKKGGSGVWPSMVTHTQNLCSAFNPSKCTHTALNIHLEQWAANAAAPEEQLGVRCPAQGSHLSRGIEGGESAGYSLPPPTIPAGPETRTLDLWVTSPTLYPLGHNCPLWRGHIAKSWQDRSPKTENSTIIYSPSCHAKASFLLCNTKGNILCSSFPSTT